MHRSSRKIFRPANEEAGASRPALYQTWRDLLFLHWSYEPGVIEDTLPEGISVDTREGRAWVGLVPFRMCRVRPRFLPPLPWLSWFLEMNVRTYVRDSRGKRGVWFYSLDANRGAAVEIARRAFKLPYFHASMKLTRGDSIEFRSRRKGTERESVFQYRGQGTPRTADPGSLEEFLLERYRLFAWDEKREVLRSGTVSHEPYRFCDAAVSAWDGHPLALAGLSLPEGAPECAHCAHDVAVSVFSLGEGATPAHQAAR